MVEVIPHSQRRTPSIFYIKVSPYVKTKKNSLKPLMAPAQAVRNGAEDCMVQMKKNLDLEISAQASLSVKVLKATLVA